MAFRMNSSEMQVSRLPHRRVRGLFAVLFFVWIAIHSGCGWNAKTLNGQAVASFQQGNYDAAKASLHQAMSHDPKNPHVYYNLARSHHETWKLQQNESDLMQAKSYYEHCLRFDADHAACNRGLAVLLVEQDRSEEAFTLLENWSLRSPHLAAPKVELARLYEEFGETDTAKEKLVEALAAEPQNSRALAALGKIREQQGDLSQALADYQRALATDPNQTGVATRIAALQASGVQANLPLDATSSARSRTTIMGPPIFR